MIPRAIAFGHNTVAACHYLSNNYEPQAMGGRLRRSNMKNQGFHRRLGFALNGIAAAFQREYSLRWHSIAALAILILLVVLKPAPLWWAIMAITVTGVLAAELFNSAIEHLADHLHPQQDPQIKFVKDCAAGAVLMLSIGALCVAAAFVYLQIG
jgi:diacylglycerol kinase (ATP)